MSHSRRSSSSAAAAAAVPAAASKTRQPTPATVCLTSNTLPNPQPEFWLSGVGGYDSAGKWEAGFDPYAKYFHKTALSLNPCGTKPMLAGPGWGNVNTIDAKWVAAMAKTQDAKCYMRELSIHVSSGRKSVAESGRLQSIWSF